MLTIGLLVIIILAVLLLPIPDARFSNLLYIVAVILVIYLVLSFVLPGTFHRY